MLQKVSPLVGMLCPTSFFIASKPYHTLTSSTEPLAAITKPGQFPDRESSRLTTTCSYTGEILIRRDPIFYYSSLTVLNVVFKACKAAERQEAFDKGSLRASLFGDPPSQPGQKALATLAEKLSTIAQVGDASTSSNFAAAMIDPDMNLL